MIQQFPYPVCLHVIPVGADQIIHVASSQCPCQPKQDEQDPSLFAHQTEDRLTEVIEQAGISDPDVHWITVAELAT